MYIHVVPIWKIMLFLFIVLNTKNDLCPHLLFPVLFIYFCINP